MLVTSDHGNNKAYLFRFCLDNFNIYGCHRSTTDLGTFNFGLHLVWSEKREAYKVSCASAKNMASINAWINLAGDTPGNKEVNKYYLLP